ARAAQDPVRAAFERRDVPGAEPPVLERGGGRIGTSPILEEQRRAADLELARHAGGDERSALIHQSPVDGGQRRAHQPRPAPNAQLSTFTMPCTWWSGRTRRMRSSALHSQAVTSDVTWARRLPCVVTTPLGLPVVPLVYRIMARRSSGTSGSGERNSLASASAVRRRRTADATGTAASRGASPAAATATAA